MLYLYSEYELLIQSEDNPSVDRVSEAEPLIFKRPKDLRAHL